MTEETPVDSALFPERVGDILRAARTKAGLDLSDIATKTRVPLRHLAAIEAGDYASLPSATYCVGFVKAYARSIGADEAGLALQLRRELGQIPATDRYEPHFVDEDETGPIPTRRLAIIGAVLAALIVGGYLVWRYTQNVDPSIEVASSQDETGVAAPQSEVPPSLPSAAGEVVLTAVSPVWVRIYDAADKVLFEKEMTSGERYVVPPDANNPMIRTGGAERITVAIDGKQVAPLGVAEKTIKDVGISAKALAARPALPATPSAESQTSLPAPAGSGR